VHTFGIKFLAKSSR